MVLAVFVGGYKITVDPGKHPKTTTAPVMHSFGRPIPEPWGLHADAGLDPASHKPISFTFWPSADRFVRLMAIGG
jgi:hypothetical protein